MDCAFYEEITTEENTVKEASRKVRMQQAEKFINTILLEKANELKKEVYMQLLSMPLKNRILFSIKLIFKSF